MALGTTDHLDENHRDKVKTGTVVSVKVPYPCFKERAPVGLDYHSHPSRSFTLRALYLKKDVGCSVETALRDVDIWWISVPLICNVSWV